MSWTPAPSCSPTTLFSSGATSGRCARGERAAERSPTSAGADCKAALPVTRRRPAVVLQYNGNARCGESASTSTHERRRAGPARGCERAWPTRSHDWGRQASVPPDQGPGPPSEDKENDMRRGGSHGPALAVAPRSRTAAGDRGGHCHGRQTPAKAGSPLDFGPNQITQVNPDATGPARLTHEPTGIAEPLARLVPDGSSILVAGSTCRMDGQHRIMKR